MRGKLQSGLPPVLLLAGLLVALGCGDGGGGGDDDVLCGNGKIDADEQCDGANLNAQTCATQGFDGGELGCTATCQFDTSACTKTPKAGVGEPCASNAECESNLCLNELVHGFPSGYCVVPCDADYSCDDVSGVCVDYGNYLCMDSCTLGGSDCRDGYACQNAGGGKAVCLPSCTDDAQCPSTGKCNAKGLCDKKCAVDADCTAGFKCGSDGVCEEISDCLSFGCNDPDGAFYCLELFGYCFLDFCAAYQPCDGVANATGCVRSLDDYICDCDEDHTWDIATRRCISFTCNAIDLGTLTNTITLESQDTCTGQALYDAGGNGVTSCTGYGTKDTELVYKLTVQAGQVVLVDMEPSDDFDASLWVTTDCSDTLGRYCVAGVDAVVTGGHESLVFTNDTSEWMTYYIVADAYKSCGAFKLTISKMSRCGDGVIEGDEQCDGAELNGVSCEELGFEGGELGCTAACRFDISDCAFTCPATDLGTVTKDITLTEVDSCTGTKVFDAGGTGVSCTGYSSMGEEILYKITLPAGTSVKIKMEPSGFDANLWVTTACDDFNGAKCVVGADDPEELTLENEGAESQTYFIVADAFSGCGTFDLTITLQ